MFLHTRIGLRSNVPIFVQLITVSIICRIMNAIATGELLRVDKRLAWAFRRTGSAINDGHWTKEKQGNGYCDDTGD